MTHSLPPIAHKKYAVAHLIGSVFYLASPDEPETGTR